VYQAHNACMMLWLKTFCIVYGQDTFCAIEVKNTTQIHAKMFNGLLAFEKDYHEAQICCLYRGNERIIIKGVLCIQVEEFLIGLRPQNTIRF
jgi:hypothetical protein